MHEHESADHGIEGRPGRHIRDRLQPELDVATPLRVRTRPRGSNCRRRPIDTHHRPAGTDDVGGEKRDVAGAAADVEDAMADAQADGLVELGESGAAGGSEREMRPAAVGAGAGPNQEPPLREVNYIAEPKKGPDGEPPGPAVRVELARTGGL